MALLVCRLSDGRPTWTWMISRVGFGPLGYMIWRVMMGIAVLVAIAVGMGWIHK